MIQALLSVREHDVSNTTHKEKFYQKRLYQRPLYPSVVWSVCICHVVAFANTLAANVMESLLLNSICVNLIGIYCFWSYVQLQNEILLISSIHYVTKLNGQAQSVLSGDRWDSREGKVSSGVVTWSEVCRAITTLMLLCNVWGFVKDYRYLFELLKGMGRATKLAGVNTAANCQVVGRWQFSAILLFPGGYVLIMSLAESSECKQMAYYMLREPAFKAAIFYSQWASDAESIVKSSRRDLKCHSIE